MLGLGEITGGDTPTNLYGLGQCHLVAHCLQMSIEQLLQHGNGSDCNG